MDIPGTYRKIASYWSLAGNKPKAAEAAGKAGM
jgi:hypothetical protein